MVAGRFKDRVQIDDADPQLPQIRELLPDSFQVAAKKVGCLIVGQVKGEQRAFIPVFVNNPGREGLRQRFAASPQKTVRENLIHNAALQKLRGMVIAPVNQQLPFRQEIPGHGTGVFAPANIQNTLLGLDFKSVKIKPGLFDGKFDLVGRRMKRRGDLGKKNLALRLRVGHITVKLFLGDGHVAEAILPQDNIHPLRTNRLYNRYPQGNFSPGTDRAKRPFTGKIPGIETNCHIQKRTSFPYGKTAVFYI